MSLLKAWGPFFQSRIRSRGRAHQVAGQVVQMPPENDELIRAQIGDKNRHTVAIRGRGPGASAHCTCSDFVGGTYCQHIWAALLDAHNKGTIEDRNEDLDHTHPAVPKARRRQGQRKKSNPEPDWVGRLSLLGMVAVPAGMPMSSICSQHWYRINTELSRQHGGLVVETQQRVATASGWSRFKPLKIDTGTLARFDDSSDCEIGAMLLGAEYLRLNDIEITSGIERSQGLFNLRPGSRSRLLKRMVQTGRCFIEDEAGTTTLSWDGDEPWVLWMIGREVDGALDANLELRRGQDHMPIDVPHLVVGGRDGMVIYDAKVARLDDRTGSRWVNQFRDEFQARGESSPMRVAAQDVPRFLDRLYLLPDLPEIELPSGVGKAIDQVQPVTHLDLFGHRPPVGAGGASGAVVSLTGQIWFDYHGTRVEPGQANRIIRSNDGRTELIRRDANFEQEAFSVLPGLGFRVDLRDDAERLSIAYRRMPQAVRELTERGWHVTAEDRVVHNTGSARFSVATGIDWFELRGGVHFETPSGLQVVDLPQILEAARQGKPMVRLDDGSEGLLPEQWFSRHGLLAAIGSVEDDHVRFKNSQAAILDALLEHRELIQVDDQFAEVRQRLREFDSIESVHEADTFVGTLRPYQRHGLGWLKFLRWFGAGGILADDMGLGKTVQVLAMLETHYDRRSDHSDVSLTDDAAALPQEDLSARPGAHKPTLIVVPRSLIFNWIDEARRFAPKLRVQSYSGSDRHSLRDTFTEHDVIVTSYGLMRRDIEELRQFTFFYVVLDEAQAIKNHAALSAKAARLLRSEHRLALTGTPVENHLGDIWSIFEFLNPGMLGAAGRFGELIRGSIQDPRSQGAATQAAQALRLFILRRSKRQVLKDLPEKTEQTIVCQMEPAQRALYDHLLGHYRGTLMNQIKGPQIGPSAMMVLEALLRLRQATCHPGLIDSQHANESSAKVDVLIDQLTELVAEGHKALVFSQFTSFLALVRPHLDAAGITYEYLDGKTQDRKTPVERFSNDPDCPVFLVSLKAGGLGLNLTAADYVFILDPWWNPAVEAQAIDRAHRIGQTRHVFAYRLICDDTVEQRIIELQQKKKKLADAIVGGQGSLLKNLTRQDLQNLLS